MKHIELSQLNEQIEALREKMHQASIPGGNALGKGETYRISRQLDALILLEMKTREKAGHRKEHAKEKELIRR